MFPDKIVYIFRASDEISAIFIYIVLKRIFSKSCRSIGYYNSVLHFIWINKLLVTLDPLACFSVIKCVGILIIYYIVKRYEAVKQNWRKLYRNIKFLFSPQLFHSIINSIVYIEQKVTFWPVMYTTSAHKREGNRSYAIFCGQIKAFLVTMA